MSRKQKLPGRIGLLALGCLLMTALAAEADERFRATLFPSFPTTADAVSLRLEFFGAPELHIDYLRQNSGYIEIHVEPSCAGSSCPRADRVLDVPLGPLPVGDYWVIADGDEWGGDTFGFTILDAGPALQALAMAIHPSAPQDQDRVSLLISTELPVTGDGPRISHQIWTNNQLEIRLAPFDEPPCCETATRLDSLVVDLGQMAPGEYEAILTVGDPPTLVRALPFTVAASTPSVLLLDRYRASITWRTREGLVGAARPVAERTAESALFSFFNLENWEVVVKVLDGCAINGHRWVFLAAATDVEFTLTVEDERGSTPDYVYQSPGGARNPPLTDVVAFACTP